MYPNITIHIFFFNDTATTEIYTLSLHDALPISPACRCGVLPSSAGRRAGRCPVVSGLGRAALRLRAPRRSDRPAHARTGPPPQSGPGARAHRARDGVPATAPAPEPVRRGVFLAEAGGYDRTGSPRHTASASRRSEEHTSELQSLAYLVCRLLLEKKKNTNNT